jgi:murein DD-endopeptidase MepM/ murein hydrolase activator NlpD
VPTTASVRVGARRPSGVVGALVCLVALALALPGRATATHTVEVADATGPSDAGAPELATSTNDDRLIYASGDRIKLYYRVKDDEPVDVTIELRRASDRQTVDSWKRTVNDSTTEYVSTTGTVDTALLAEKRYYFHVVAVGSNGAVARSSDLDDTRRDSFNLYHNWFPVRGDHNYGSSGSTFGAPRSGHSHQGQDVFAACGTKLQAARGGEVQYAGYQSAAGHYLVIDGKKTGVDYVYMHLRQAPTVGTGDRVETTQTIGQVGDSGNATGCHLHFELWGAPGWYEGGSPFDPLPSLKHWDSYS